MPSQPCIGPAIAQAGKFGAAAIRDAIRKVTDPAGEVVRAGPLGLARALQLIKDKKPLRYVGVIGPVGFDRNGDIVGLFHTRRLTNGELTVDISRPARFELAPGLEISRVVTGLWQVADMERGGTLLDPVQGADDMADHCGSAELITGEPLGRAHGQGVRAFTKWCPPSGPVTAEVVRTGVMRPLERLRATEAMSALCLERGVKLPAYGTLGGGFLSGRWPGRDVPAAVIVGARLGESEHRAHNLALFGFALDAEDRATLAAAFAGTKRIRGDCGDGIPQADLPDGLGRPQPPPRRTAAGVAGTTGARPRRPRARRQRQRVGGSDAGVQAVCILDKIAASLGALGGRLDDVVRTRV